MRAALILAAFALAAPASAQDLGSALGGFALPEAPPAAGGKAAAPGKVVLDIRPAEKKADAPIEKTLRETGVYDDIVADLNARFNWPLDLAVEAKTCGVAPSKATSWYKPSKKKITICYEDLRYTAGLMAPHAKAPMTPVRLALGYARHILYHEAGHAVIDIFHLPTVGREEDAADQFATLSLVDAGGEKEIAARLAAQAWLYSSRENEPDFSDTHSFDKQRYYDMLCLIYGRDSQANKQLVGKGKLPEDRAESCPDEYKHARQAWATILGPYLKKPMSVASNP